MAVKLGLQLEELCQTQGWRVTRNEVNVQTRDRPLYLIVEAALPSGRDEPYRLILIVENPPQGDDFVLGLKLRPWLWDYKWNGFKDSIVRLLDKHPVEQELNPQYTVKFSSLHLNSGDLKPILNKVEDLIGAADDMWRMIDSLLEFADDYVDSHK